ncbi:MAG: glutamate--tRNA ligase [Bacillota bacterium]|nr:glutamate--tRNA ligase [Bacillota bacterium]
MPEVRVRFAPSPTGELHIGGARTALFNLLFVRKEKGTFVLRIDDTDTERSRNEYIDKLIESMSWLGLNWDEGPYYQSQRLKEYQKEANRLLVEGKAYQCYCSVEELAAGREEARKENKTYLYPGICRNLTQDRIDVFEKEGRKPVIRLITPDFGSTVVHDEIRGEVSFENEHLDDFIIVKSNGQPTYNFASVVDDMQMKISHIIRAEEHLSNTPRQQLCFNALGYSKPRFAHVPMILAPDRSKLSKRHGATSVEEFRNEGYLPEALINYMVLLGWSPGNDEEILSLDSMIDKFSLKKVNKTAAIYDINKLGWMNSHYLREYNLERLYEAAVPFFKRKGLVKEPVEEFQKAFIKRVINAVRERAKTLIELADLSVYFFESNFSYDEKGLKKHFLKEGSAEFLQKTAEVLKALPEFNHESAENCINLLAENLEVSKGCLIPLARLALTGVMGGPGLFEIMILLGKEETAARLERAAEYIEKELR